ncbi:MAG: DinB family protein [Anaerolineales bacterium]
MEQLREYRVILLNRLTQQPEEFAALLAALPEPEWHVRRNDDGTTLHQLAAHLRDAEVVAFLPRFYRILSEERPHLERFPHHRWSLENGYRRDEPLARILAEFRQHRAEAVARMRTLTADEWNRVGVHPPSGPRTAQWWAERIYTHVRNHLAEMQNITDGK